MMIELLCTLYLVAACFWGAGCLLIAIFTCSDDSLTASEARMTSLWLTGKDE